MTRKSFMTLAITLCTSFVAVMAVAQDDQSAQDGRAIAQAYIAGMESGDLESLGVLFLPDDRSSIMENTSDEGSWEHYRDHHLKPEMGSTENFSITIAKESVESYGDATIVRQTGSFSVDVEGETREYRVAVSYFMVTDNDQLRIAHLHWASRPE
jgi:SnoaL-like protein